MNIAIFTDTYYPEVNGVVTSVMILKRELEKVGHKVYIFTTTNPEAKNDDQNVFRLPSIPFLFLPSRRLGAVYSLKAANIFKKLDIDIIHTQTEFSLGFFGKQMAKQYGIPVVHTYHTMYKDYAHYISKGRFTGITNELARKFSRKYCNSCQAIIAPTNKVFDLLKSYRIVKPIKVIPSGIDLGMFSENNYTAREIEELRIKLGIDKKDYIILGIGRLAKEKSFDVIIQGMPQLLKKVPNAKLLLVGDGPSKDELKALANSLGCSSSIIFAGEQPWHSIARYYALGDVFVSASVTETQGLTIIEAMSAKVPVVVKRDKNTEGTIIHNKTGMLFNEDAELPDRVFKVLTDREKRQELVNNAYEKAIEFSSVCFAKNVLGVYMEVLGSSCVEALLN